eukprot:5951850-Alexandrium_andersonii.AAC.1
MLAASQATDASQAAGSGSLEKTFFPGGLPDSVKSSEAWKDAWGQLDRCIQALRDVVKAAEVANAPPAD